MFDLLFSCSVMLWRKWRRTLLTTLNIAIGVCSVVIISSLGSTGVNLIDNEVGRLGLSGYVLTPDSKLTDYRPDSEVCRKIQDLDWIESVSAASLETGLVRMHGMISNAVVWGVGENYENVMTIPLHYGRYITTQEILSGADVCMMDIQSAKEFYHRGNIVGKVLSLECNGTRRDLEIVGIVEAGGNGLQNVLGDYIPSFLYIPSKTFETITGKKGYSQITMDIAQGKQFNEKEIVSIVERISGKDNSFMIEDLSQKNDHLKKTLGRVSSTLNAIAVISLIVAAVGTMAIMLSSVKERTREIGIKKSLGATNQRIMLEFLVESILMSCIGTIIGTTVSSFFILTAGKLLPDIPFSVDGIGLAAAVCIALGTVFGIIPALQAARLDPIESLRNEK